MSINNLIRRLMMTKNVRNQTTQPIRQPRDVGRRIEELEDLTTPTTGLSPADQQLVAAYGQLPLSFEPNQGQTAAQVQYLSQGSGYTLFLTSTGSVLSLQQPVDATDPTSLSTVSTTSTGVALAMNLVGSNPQATVVGQDQLPGASNYFLGNNPNQWHTDIASYGKVAYQDVYPGVNLVYYGNQQQLEYDFVVAPGVDPGLIRFNIQGAENVSLDASGNLVLQTASGNVLEHAPVLYQQVGGTQHAVSGQFVLFGASELGFQVGTYNKGLPLVIDPVLSYSSYLGGNSNDRGLGIAVDGSGNAYVTGFTLSTNFPTTTGAFQTHYGGGASYDDFVTKLNASGTALVYSTYLGGNNTDVGNGIAVDGSGNAYITGYTLSTNFPTTAGAFQTSYGGGYDAFVTKLNASGTALVYSTYLGGNNDDYSLGIAVDGSGNAYITGETTSTNLPTTTGAFQTSIGSSQNAFVTKLNASGTALVYSTYLGGNDSDEGYGIAVDGSGNAYVTGYTQSTNFPTTHGAFQTSIGGSQNAYVTKLNASGTALVYSTYLGGNGNDRGIGIAVDGSGNAYVTGETTSTNFPTTHGAFQTSIGGSQNAYVTKLNASGTALVYSAYLGGNGIDWGLGIAVDASGNAYVTGETTSTNFPTTTGAFQTSIGGSQNAFVTKLNASGTALFYSTYLGGNGTDAGNGIAEDGSGSVYIIGVTTSTNFPTTSGAFQTSLNGSQNAFVAKFVIGTLSTIVDSSGNLVIADTLGNADSVTVVVNGGNYVITDTLQAFIPGSVPAGTTLSNNNQTLTVPIAQVAGSIQFNLGGGNNTLIVDYSGGSFANPISYNGGDFAGTTDGLVVQGSGTQSATYTPSGSTDGSGTITSPAGDITFSNLTPVDITGLATATMNFPNANDIVNIANGTDYLSGGTNAALDVTGTSGGVAFEQAAFWNDTDLVIDTTAVPGTDAVTISNANNTNNITNFVIKEPITNAGTIVVNGAATFPGSIHLTAGQSITVNANITGGTGGTTLLAAGSGAQNTVGVTVQGGAVVSTTGSGPVSVTGTGGGGTGTDNWGVNVTGSGSAITSGGGAVSITGIGTANSEAIDLESSGAIASGSNAPITITADSLNILPTAAINSGTGPTTIVTLTPGTLIDLGGPEVLTGSPLTLGLTATEIAQITAGTLNIGNTSSGAVAITAASTFSSPIVNVTTGSGNAIAFTGTGSLTGVGGTVTLSTSGTGAITSTTAAIDITVGAGTISLNAGLGGIGASGSSIIVSGTNLDATTSGNGNQYLRTSDSITIDPTGLNAGTGTVGLNGGTFILSDNNPINANATLNVNGATVAMGAFNEMVNTVTLTSGAISGTTGVLTSTNTFQVQSGTVSAILAGTNGLTKTTGATVTLSGANTYGGATTVNGGTLTDGVTNTLPTGTALTVGSSGIFDLAGFSQQVATPAGSGIITDSESAATLMVTGGGNFSGTITGTTSLSTSVNGTLTLSGVNTYSGETTITAGTLLVTGGLTESAISVLAPGTVGGTGTVQGLSISGDLAPGVNGVGALTSEGNTTFTNANAEFVVQLDGTGPGSSNQLAESGGTVALGTQTTLVVTESVPTSTGQIFTIISRAGHITGTFVGLTNNALFVSDGLQYRITYLTGSVTLTDIGPALTPPTLPPGDIGLGYNQSISPVAGSPPATLSVSGVTNPTGLAISGSGTGTISVSGTPTTMGTVSFTVIPTYASGTGVGTVYSFTVNPAVVFTPASLPTGEVSLGYNQSITTTGGSGAVTLLVSGVTNSTGLTIGGSGSRTITVSGTPTTHGTVAFTVTPTDAAGTGAGTVYSLSVNPAVVLSPITLPAGQVGLDYKQGITSTGGSSPVTLAVSGVTNSTGLKIDGNGTGTITISGTPTAAGTVTLTVTPTDTIGSSAGTVYSFAVNPIVVSPPPPPPPLTPQPVLIGGNPNGSVQVYTKSNGTYTLQETFTPFGNIPTDVRTAVGDVNGDGIPDYIFATGPGTPFEVTVLSGAPGNPGLVAPFDPFLPAPPLAQSDVFTAGGFVSAGDFMDNGRDQIVVSPDQSGGPRVAIYDMDGAAAAAAQPYTAIGVNTAEINPGSGLTRINNFLSVNPDFRGGARTAVGDLNGDGVPDLAIAAGYGGGPAVLVINGTKVLTTDGFTASDDLIGDFFAFNSTLRDGAYLAIGDVLGNGQQDLILGPGAGGPAEVEVLSGVQIVNSGAVAAIANPVALFTPTGLGPDGSGMRVAVAATGVGDQVNVVVGAGRNMPGLAKVYPGTGFTSGSTSEPTGGQLLDPFGGGTLTDGIFVG
jgi:hypothetical protein